MASNTLFKFLLAAVILSLYLANAQTIKFIPCDNVTQDATINEVDVIPCPKLPCEFKRGTNVSVSVTFTMGGSKTVTKATTVVHGVIGGLPIPFPTPYTDACATTGIKCPLKPDTKNLYKGKLFVRKEYPQVNVYVKWEMQDQDSKDVFCFQVPASVV
ncbi:NPC intracellular cholesterol transporter 2-like [Asterias rubens]|uniref:NPC intracellular cholesterol transporter 2-like n=1 Tax=Asterias rubens TaxID=7604 RepID=UPI00145535EF|nr:NPC intracellular cholesterol transporter 2-like [Asterias rubens]